MKLRNYLILLFFIVLSTSSFSQFNVVFLADYQYANNQTWITQIKGWGATGINLRLYRTLLQNNDKTINSTEWQNVVNCLTLLTNSTNGLDIYIRVNMFNTNSAWGYAADDFQQTKNNRIMYSTYYTQDVPTLNLTSQNALSGRINFFKTIDSALASLPTAITSKIKLIVPTISQDDETELMASAKYPPAGTGTWGWLSGYSAPEQSAFVTYLNTKYQNSVTNLNAVWGSNFSNIDLSNININNFDWENIRDAYQYYPKGRKDFIDFLTSQLKRFIDTCAYITHHNTPTPFKMGVQFGSVYDGSIEFKAFYDVTPLVENVDMIFCDDVADYQPNFNFAADYLRSVCNYWNKKHSTTNLNFGTETNWPGYASILPDTLVKYWTAQLQSYYDRGATTLSISHWGTTDLVVPYYTFNPQTYTYNLITYHPGDIIINNQLTNQPGSNCWISSPAYSGWKSTLASFHYKNLRSINFPYSSNNSAIHISPVMGLYSRTAGASYTLHSHNLGTAVHTIPTYNGQTLSSLNIYEFPLYQYIKSRSPYGNSNYPYYIENADFITDYMVEKWPQYFINNFTTLLLTASSYFISDASYLNLMSPSLSTKTISHVTWFSDNGHGEYAFAPGIRNEYDTYRSPIHLIWRTRPDLKQIWPNANLPASGSGHTEDFISWALNYGCGFYNSSLQEYPEWIIKTTSDTIYNYDNTIRTVWNSRSDLQSVFTNGHSKPDNSWNILSWIAYSFQYGYALPPSLARYNNWPYIGPTINIPKGIALKQQSKIDLSFKLAQNYPNPFNPTTLISYQIPNNNLVTIKVYDVLGREVATLLNEYKVAGSYQVEFDASKLSSGLYLYRITSGNYSETKKMMLLK